MAAEVVASMAAVSVEVGEMERAADLTVALRA